MDRRALFIKTNQAHFKLYRNYCRNISKHKDLVHSIHQLRVVSRKLSNSLWVFKGLMPAHDYDVCYKTFRKVTRLLGKARDVDVQLQMHQGYYSRHKSDNPVVKNLEHKLSAKRKSFAADMAAVVKPSLQKRFSRKVNSSLTALKKNLKDFDAKELKEFGVKKIVKRLHTLLGFELYVANPQASKQLHCLRIQAKKLRFTLEALKVFTGKEFDHLSAFAVKVQKHLGAFHDCEEWGDFLDSTLKQTKKLPAKRVLVSCINYATNEKLRCYRDFVKVWKQARKQKLFEKVLLKN